MARITLKMATNATPSVTNANKQYAFRITEYARGANCTTLGNEYNALQEKDYLNRVNPYQDPTRGRLNKVQVDASGNLTNSIDADVLINLSGPDSVIGRGIAMYECSSTGVLGTSPVLCCTIGYDKQPTTDQVTETHHHHAVPFGAVSGALGHTIYGIHRHPMQTPGYNPYSGLTYAAGGASPYTSL